MKKSSSFSHINTSYYSSIHLNVPCNTCGCDGVTLYYPYPEPLDNIASTIYKCHERRTGSRRSTINSNSTRSSILFTSLHCSTIGIVLIPIIVREFISFLKPALKEERFMLDVQLHFQQLDYSLQDVHFHIQQ